MENLWEAAMSGYDFGHLARHLFVCFWLFMLTPCFCMIDLASGIYTAKKLNQRIRSHKLRDTTQKIVGYWLLQSMTFFLGLLGTFVESYEWPYLSMAAAAAVGIIEGRSVIEHARRRKDHAAKIPETVHEIVDWLGDETLRDLIIKAAKEKALKMGKTDPNATEAELAEA